MKRVVRRLLQAAARGRIGARVLRYLASEEAIGAWIDHPGLAERFATTLLRNKPQAVAEPVFLQQNLRAWFDTVSEWPDELAGFGDLAFLFSSGQLNVGVAILAFDEAAFLYRLARSLRNATLVEIGRFKGGSTLLLAAAMDDSCRLLSYDWFGTPDAPLPKSGGTSRHPAKGSRDLDAQLSEALQRYGLDEKVQVLVADSQTAPPPLDGCDLVFVDGDHAYEGVAADLRNWAPHLRVGGHLLFHDAIPRTFSPAAVGVMQLVREIEAAHGDCLARQHDVGSIAHFVCTKRVAIGGRS